MKKEKGIVNLQGKKYATYRFVLNKAHKEGLNDIETELIQVPTEDNYYTAIVKAKIWMKMIKNKKETIKSYSAYGDASPENTSSFTATALIRMAETRAKGRAMRDAVNIGETLAEELPDDIKTVIPPAERKSAERKSVEKKPACEECGQLISPAIVRFSIANYHKKLCIDCQQKQKETKRIVYNIKK